MAMQHFDYSASHRESKSINENHYYKALSLEKLGREAEAIQIYDGLIDLGKKRLQSTEADFFAKFGEKETPDDKLSNAYYLLGLGYLGKKMNADAKKMFTEAFSLNINNVWAEKFLAQMEKMKGI